MRKKYKKIVLLVIFITLIIFLGYYIISARNYKNLISYYKNIAIANSNVVKEEKKWSTYHDEKYGFSIDYPSGLDVESMYNHKVILSKDNKKYQIINGGVNFSLGGGPGISVEVFDNSLFLSLDEWFNAKNKEKTLSHYVIDSQRTVDGYQAVSIYEVDDSGEIFKSPQITAFLKNKQLFIITTSEEFCNKILDSFKFDK